MSYQIKIPSCIFGGAGSIENVKAVIEKENAKKVIIFTDKRHSLNRTFRSADRHS